MKDILEIFAAMLAVYGGYTLLSAFRTMLLFPYRVRKRLRAAILLEEGSDTLALLRYANFLKRERKISSERLIILVKNDIMEGEEVSLLRDASRYLTIRMKNSDTE